MNRRSVLGVLASSSLTGVAGRLGDSGNDTAEPISPVVNREVPIDGGAGGWIRSFRDLSNTWENLTQQARLLTFRHTGDGLLIGMTALYRSLSMIEKKASPVW